jgi:nitronate monooxygenase
MANRTAWSAGHSVSGVHGISSVCELVETLAGEYRQARRVVMSD